VEKLVANGIRITYAVTESEILPIAYETVYKNSSAYYEGTKKVQTSGKNGEKQRIHLVQYENDKEVNKVLMEEKTVKQAVNEVILVGTKKSTASTGSYAWPTKNVYITSNYGWRTVFGKREYHYGIDLRASVGTSIYAADGGKVIYVGTSGGYGKLIKIQHDNGDVTYYAHLNSYSVKKGDRVYKGQLIAKSGKTGRVTGPHLHFEIRKNGVRVNPTKYLPKL
ncbi:MAG: peptidoglycan DD-metalloendopeptidase family protein, partial [Clostridia bacterium]|nr:peptidoglycan DD-metalloendopeptidase family protein [Clostridia bacterium]